MHSSIQRGFTLVEVMVTVGIVAVLASIAMPSYTAYVQRSKVPPGLDALSSYFTRMEQRYQDTGNYANGTACGVALPTAANYTFSCALATTAGQAYTATATGTGALAGYVYTITSAGARNTTSHPKGTPTTACWTVRGKSCDA
jgi:type IV pilus assembly protein PilE